jgi:hypothetical protein
MHRLHRKIWSTGSQYHHITWLSLGQIWREVRGYLVIYHQSNVDSLGRRKELMKNLDCVRRSISSAGCQKRILITNAPQFDFSGSRYSRKASVDDIQLSGVDYQEK